MTDEAAKCLTRAAHFSDGVRRIPKGGVREIGKDLYVSERCLTHRYRRHGILTNVPPFHIASIYNQLGDTEQALAWIEKA